MIPMDLVLGTVFAGLLGTVFGSFLNVCATRWPVGESVVGPRSHCRSCDHTLAWHQNIPLVSWLALRGRCATCGTWIGWRYPAVEFAVGFTWALAAWQTLPALWEPGLTATSVFDAGLLGVEKMILSWLLVGLAIFDAENLWLPDRLTLGGAVLGLPFTFLRFGVHWVWKSAPLNWTSGLETHGEHIFEAIIHWTIGIVLAPGIILFTRWAYKAVRRRHGVGLGDAKLMLLLAVWLGLSHTLLAFVLAVAIGTVFALVLLALPGRGSEPWAVTKLPLGTFLCVGGIVSAFWGTPLINAYLRAAGFY
jgi:leader peptidase (prepilin peptidase) / N-methyltransferase